ncbi:MAG: TldD/PmbA family protein [bacterium]
MSVKSQLLTSVALQEAKRLGATYADIRLSTKERENIVVRNGNITALDSSLSEGFGIRVIFNGAWGFAASPRVEEAEVKRVAALAVDIARASGLAKERDVALAPELSARETWLTPFVEDPFKVSMSEKLNLLLAIDEILRKSPKIIAAESGMRFDREHRILATSEGTFADQTLLLSGAGYSVTAVEGSEVQVRSYPNSFGGQYMSLGYELVRGLHLLEQAERVREEAIALLSAKPCPKVKTTLILDGSQLALQIHESVGHATELDRVLGMEANFAGTSFATLEKEGKFRYGSDIVNLFCDSTIPAGLATFGFDDDGVRAQRWYLVKNGIFVGYQTSREIAGLLGRPRSTGNCRAEDWSHIPIIRNGNLCLEPGEHDADDMIAEVDDGIYMETNKSWSIDQKRLNFQFTCELGREIRGGKLGDFVKNPTYQSVTPEFWGSCDAIAGPESWVLWGVVNCGKGQPGQVAAMSHGASPARFRNIQVGAPDKVQ